MKRPLVLLTNDDGIRSPGLRAVAEALAGEAELVVVAPSRQQTSMSRSLCGDAGHALEKIDYEVAGRSIPAYHCDWSPAQLMLHALDVLFLNQRPDLVVSGINYGENLGSNTTISGTIGAALQAAAAGRPALAVSVQTSIDNHRRYGALDWTASRHFTALFVRKILSAAPLPADVDVVNVNVPADANPSTPWKLTRQSRLPYFTMELDAPHAASRPRDGRVVVDIDDRLLEPDSDIHAILKERVVSVTPLSIDLTSRAGLAAWCDNAE